MLDVRLALNRSSGIERCADGSKYVSEEYFASVFRFEE
jgi:hypothetical protein